MSINICAFRDVMCGKLFCDKGQNDPNYGRLVQFNNCKATFYSEPESDAGQVDTGTKCGDEKVKNKNLLDMWRVWWYCRRVHVER